MEVKHVEKYGYGHPPYGDNKKRTVERYIILGKSFLSPLEILEILNKSSLEYSAWNTPSRIRELYVRDKALMSFLVLSCARINEPLKVMRSQVDIETDPDFVLIRRFRISKRKKGKIEFVAELPMTKKRDAVLYPFTEMFLEHLENVGSRSKIFKIGERRARQIISGMDPMLFPHYIRACSLTYFLNTLHNPLAVAKIFGLKKLETLMKYYGKTWEAFREELSL